MVVFQSLFLWIFRSYKKSKCLIKKRLQGFNPCSYGSFVLTADMLVNPVKEVAKFQSLFLWIFRSYVVSAIFNALAITAVSILVLMDLSFLQAWKEA